MCILATKPPTMWIGGARAAPQTCSVRKDGAVN